MDALTQILNDTKAQFQKTQQQYADMQGFVAPPVRQGTVLSSGQSYPSPNASNAIMELPTAKYDAGKVGSSVDPSMQTTTQQRGYEGGYDAADQKAAADIPGFGTAGWTDIGPVGRAAMTMTEALPGIGAISKAAGLGVNMSNATYASNVRESLGMSRLDAWDVMSAVAGVNNFGRNLDSALQAGVDMSSMAKNDISTMGFDSRFGMTGPEDEIGLGFNSSDVPAGIGGNTGFGDFSGLGGPEDEVGGFGGYGGYGNDNGGGGGSGTSGNDNNSAGDTDSSDGDADGHGDTGGGSW